ncbi:MAG: lipoprotein [Candidatus Marinimicrobia bacterium]|nr:lipoprotein [Candidatus Neomarinimicrobiota bacterium]
MKKIIIFTGFVLLLASCAQVAESLIDGAINGASRAITERAANAAYKKLASKEKLPAPSTALWNQFMVAQAQVIFTYSFAPGGLWISKNEFKPGEYTNFKMIDEADKSEIIIERAYLKKMNNGDQWWRTSWKDGEDEWVYEALLSSQDGRLLRLRGKDSENNVGEIPVTDQVIDMNPGEVSEESIEGAKLGSETIKTPAGSFKTDRIHFMAITGEEAIDWWITDEIPGGVVKYQLVDTDKTILWTNILTEYGNNASTQLSSF